MMKKIKSDKSLMQAAEVFLSLHSSSAEIQKAGEQAMTILYNGMVFDTNNIMKKLLQI